MISFEIFLMGLLGVSVLTGLVTEAVKIILNEHGVKYKANTLTGFIAFTLSIAVGIGYVYFNAITFTPPIIVSLIALAFMSWLCAMVGYDKVVQAVSQFKTNRKGDI